MAGRGPAPKENRRNEHDRPSRGEWQVADGVGWQHGEVPDPPDGLLGASRVAWETWFGSWFGSFWGPEDLPGLRQLVRLYDQVEREPTNASMHTQLRQLMDTYGVTPKGQKDNRWKRPDNGGSEPVKRSKRAGERRESSLEVIQGGNSG